MAGKLKSLILVESAGKARALKKFVGSSYLVLSTDGLLKDLPKSRIGIDEKFLPDYITIRGKGKLLQELRRETLKAGRIFLATNPDAAGEFLAKQCCQLFGINEKSFCRMTFDELSKPAVKASIDAARPIDEKLVDAFQTRQLIDKFISHKVGEYLACKIYRGVKVGRFRAMLLKMIKDARPAGNFKIEQRLTAETLQELAARDLNFSTSKTRLIAEQLYEGFNFESSYGGLIKFPHGEIQLTNEVRAPEEVKAFLTDSQFKLYELIHRALTEGFSPELELDGRCTDLSLMTAFDAAKISWAEFYSGGVNSLLKRQYIQPDDGGYHVTALGEKVLSALAGFFDADFNLDTYKKIAGKIDDVAEGKAAKFSVIEETCAKFDKDFSKAMESLGSDAVPKEEPVVETGELCEKCGHPMILKHGRYGVFLACSNYPACKNIKPYVEYLEQKCPKCGARLTKRKFRGGKILYGCESCDFQTWDEPIVKPCRECESTMFLHKLKDRAPMIYCGNENCSTRINNPINKILAEIQRRREAKTSRRENPKA